MGTRLWVLTIYVLSKNKKTYLYFFHLKIIIFTALKSLRERLRTHKVFIKDQCFFLSQYHKISIKLHVVDMLLESPRRGDSNTHPQHVIL